MNSSVDFYFLKAGKWREELMQLRMICLSSGLAEELKWGCPCYTLEGSNIVLIHHFKEYCALLFFKGALLPDPQAILIQQTENVQAARQIRFRHVEEVVDNERVLKAYIQEAVKVEKAGLKVALKRTADFNAPEEFQKRLDKMPDLRAAFRGLTPGRQRAYLLHFSQAKQSKTREARIEKYIPQILEGKGIDD